MRVIAIDPGAHGAVAMVETGLAAPSYSVFKLPESECDIAALLFSFGPVESAVIERVHAAPRLKAGSDGERVQMGATSAFSFGMSYGRLRGILCSMLHLKHLMRYEDVPPQRWQRNLGLGDVQGPNRKRRLKELAVQRFPHLKPTLVTADALLILEWFLSQRQPPAADGTAGSPDQTRARREPGRDQVEEPTSSSLGCTY